MKKILLVLLFPLLTFAEDYKSQFFVGAIFGSNEIIVSKQDDDRSFNGFGINLLRFGRDFRLKKWFSVESSVGVDRFGWTWEMDGEENKRNVIDPFLSLAFNFHIMDSYIGLGGTYGRPFEVFSEVNGKEPKEEFSFGSSASYGVWISLGYTILQHYRIALAYYANWMNSSDFSSVWVCEGILGVSFNYLF